MESNVRKLYLVDEFDRVYKQLHRPAQAVVKTTSSINLDRTLRDASLPDDEKVNEIRRRIAQILTLARRQTVCRSTARQTSQEIDR